MSARMLGSVTISKAGNQHQAPQGSSDEHAQGSARVIQRCARQWLARKHNASGMRGSKSEENFANNIITLPKSESSPDLVSVEDEACTRSSGSFCPKPKNLPPLQTRAEGEEEDVPAKQDDRSPLESSGLGRRQMLAALAGCSLYSSFRYAVDKGVSNPLSSLGSTVSKFAEAFTPRYLSKSNVAPVETQAPRPASDLATPMRRQSSVDTQSPEFSRTPFGRGSYVDDLQPPTPASVSASPPTPSAKRSASGKRFQIPLSPAREEEVETTQESERDDGDESLVTSAVELVTGAVAVHTSITSDHHHPSTVKLPHKLVDQHSDTSCCAVKDEDGLCVVGNDGLVEVDENCLLNGSDDKLCAVPDDFGPADLTPPPPAPTAAHAAPSGAEHSAHHLKNLSGPSDEVEKTLESAVEDGLNFKSVVDSSNIRIDAKRIAKDAIKAEFDEASGTASDDSPKVAGAEGGEEASSSGFGWAGIDPSVRLQPLVVTLVRCQLLELMEANMDLDFFYSLGVAPFFVTLTLGIATTVSAQMLTDYVILWNSSPAVIASPKGVPAWYTKGEVLLQNMFSVKHAHNALRYTCFSRLYAISLVQLAMYRAYQHYMGDLYQLPVANQLDHTIQFVLALGLSTALSGPLHDFQKQVFYKILFFIKTLQPDQVKRNKKLVKNFALGSFFVADVFLCYAMYLAVNPFLVQ